MKYLLFCFFISYSALAKQCPKNIDVSFSSFELMTRKQVIDKYLTMSDFVSDHRVDLVMDSVKAAKAMGRVDATLTYASKESWRCKYRSPNKKLTAWLSIDDTPVLVVTYVVKAKSHNVSFHVDVDSFNATGIEVDPDQEIDIYSAEKTLWGFVYGNAIKFSVE